MSKTKQRHFTTYVRVLKWKALQVEVHPMSGENSQFPRWFEDRHLQEVLQLLRGPIFERVKLKRSEIGKNMSKSSIATGPTVRIGYVFRPKPEYQMCLLPTSQPLYTSDSEEDSSAPACQYRSLGLHHEKLVVYSCLLKEKTVHSSMAQIMSAIGENSPQPQIVSISSYFNRVIPPGTPSQSSQAHSSTTEETSSSRSSLQQKEKPTAPPSDSRKRKLKCIIKRSGPKLSKKSKKIKTASIDVKTFSSIPVVSSCSRNMDDVNEQDYCDNEFSRLSFYGDLPETESEVPRARTKGESSQMEVMGKTNENKLCTNSESEKTEKVNCYKKCKMKTDIDGEEVERQSGNRICSSDEGEQFEERDDCANASDEINFVQECGKDVDDVTKHGGNTGDKAVGSGEGKGSPDSDSSEVYLYMVTTPSPKTDSGCKHGKAGSEMSDSVEPQSQTSQTKLYSEPEVAAQDSTSESEGQTLQKAGKRVKMQSQTSPAQSRTFQKQGQTSLTRGQIFQTQGKTLQGQHLSSHKEQQHNEHLPLEGKSSKAFKSKKFVVSKPAASTGVGTSVSCRNSKESFDINGNSDRNFKGMSERSDTVDVGGDDPHCDDLPKIALKKRDRSWRKSLTLMINARRSPEKLEKENEVIDCEKINCDLMEDLAKLPKHKMYLTEDFREELKGVTHESELTESQIEKMVLGSKNYLRSIFMGKHKCWRHEDYKKGGTARFNLNYQVNLGMFTEVQQDAVMETLMTIFCKQHHKYMDYILKVLLPEMLIWILMEIKHTSYEETEVLMSGVIM